MPGTGHSSPVIWGNKLFLTTASETGTARSVLCFDAQTGKQLWIRSIQLNANPKHPKSSWASATPAVDGERVYVAFADVERHLLSAYDFDGNQLWQEDLGKFESQHGQGASPILFEDLVILVNDQDGDSSIFARDKRTGHAVWTAPRKSGTQSTSYATPFIYQPKQGPPQLICSSSLLGYLRTRPENGQNDLDDRVDTPADRRLARPLRRPGAAVLRRRRPRHADGGGRPERARRRRRDWDSL